ncbi:glucose-1-phosphate adenylyltransferase family protein [Nocardioides caldifontis]|uniref:glucose-1-phosphate adenylyltransferase family protein n=1 Tax=Nocardioides caldifontis TaxID=2588938 RepID=UPI0011DFD728|nr:sugar phosphate nucleotidyltransferase [Nocardioides caldifontis]
MPARTSRRADVLALVQAGGAGGRMDVLTRERAKPALPYGGVHRLIDFALSNLVHAGIHDVWVSVEYQVASIDEYLSGGRPWDLDSNRGGFRRMVPQTGSGPATEDQFAYGNGDLLLRMARDLEAFGAPTLVVSSADHVFSADLRPVIADHVASGKAATLLTSEVSREEASANVVVTVDGDGLVTGLEEKPEEPSSTTVATELFVYQLEPLMATLRDLRAELSGEAEGDDSGIGDFAEHLLPRLVERGEVRAVPLEGYWRDLGRPGAYLKGHRDLLAGKVPIEDERPVISKWQDRSAARVRAGARLEDSMLSPGCDVAGEVVRSVLGPGVVVEAGARVVDSVLFEDVVVEAGASVATSVVDEASVVGRGATVGSEAPADDLDDDAVVLVGQECRIGAGTQVPAGGRLEPGTTT